MKLSAALTLFTGVGSALAATSPPGLTYFHLMALRSASPIHFGQVSAAQNNIFINLPSQKTECKASPTAVFYIKDAELFLYTGDSPARRLFVDRSGMGQGKLGYIPASSPLPPRFEVKGWAIDKNGDLFFNKQNLLACPNPDNSWTVWVVTDNAQPGGNKGCLGFIPRTTPDEKPVPCEYK